MNNMSHRRHLLSSSFRPSVYSTGIQPRQAYSVHPPVQGQGGGYAYGSLFDYTAPGMLWNKVTGGDGDGEEPSLLLKYWWVFAVGAPIVYIVADKMFNGLRGTSEPVDVEFQPPRRKR